MIYDITTRENALATLEQFTQLKKEYWVHEVWKYQKIYENSKGIDLEKILYDILQKYEVTLDDVNFDTFDVVFLHVTTSNNECVDYKKYGILDLQSVYKNRDTELRRFLDQRNIYIDLGKKQIIIEGKEYDISTDKGITNYTDRSKDKGFYVGNKFYNDFRINGFYHLIPDEPYGGDVDKRPEILNDILKFTNYDICKEWEITHKTYIIKAKVPYTKIFTNFCISDEENDIINELLNMAFSRYFYLDDSEKLFMLKTNCTVAPEEIIECYRHDFRERRC